MTTDPSGFRELTVRGCPAPALRCRVGGSGWAVVASESIKLTGAVGRFVGSAGRWPAWWEKRAGGPPALPGRSDESHQIQVNPTRSRWIKVPPTAGAEGWPQKGTKRHKKSEGSGGRPGFGSDCFCEFLRLFVANRWVRSLAPALLEAGLVRCETLTRSATVARLSSSDQIAPNPSKSDQIKVDQGSGGPRNTRTTRKGGGQLMNARRVEQEETERTERGIRPEVRFAGSFRSVELAVGDRAGRGVDPTKSHQIRVNPIRSRWIKVVGTTKHTKYTKRRRPAHESPEG